MTDSNVITLDPAREARAQRLVKVLGLNDLLGNYIWSVMRGRAEAPVHGEVLPKALQTQVFQVVGPAYSVDEFNKLASKSQLERNGFVMQAIRNPGSNELTLVWRKAI
jgi:hypothetical protein